VSIPTDLPLPPPDPNAANPYEARDAAILERMLAAQSAAVRRLPVATHTMTELALLPEFTPRLLADAGLIEQVGSIDVLADHALFESKRKVAGSPSPEQVLWVRADVRAEVGSRIRAEQGLDGPRQLLRELRGRLDGVQGATGRGFRAWLHVAELVIADPGGRQALEAVERAELHEAGTIVDLIGALSDVLGGALPAVAHRARILLAAKVRTAEALKTLEDYQPREALERSLADPLRDHSGRMLHLRGDGGVGKSMLLRYAATPKFAELHAVPGLLFLSVDFDHLDPRYPVLRPLLLLEAMEIQLVFAASIPTTAVDRVRGRFLDAVDSANETASGHASAPDAVSAGIMAFAELIRLTGRQVVLVLDTAEQLAKEELDSDLSPLEATLTLLDRLYDHLADQSGRPVTVVFAGRRPLRSAVSHRWGEIEEIPVLGFDHDEAVSYLDRKLGRVEVGLLKASEVRSREASTEPRYNPFELAIWTRWLIDEQREGRTLDLETLHEDSDAYVQRRILGRVTEKSLRPLVAPAVVLGRFEVALLAPTSLRAGLDHSRAVSALADQEWVRVVERDVDGRPDVVEVDEHLQDRLRAALAVSQFPLDRWLLADDLKAAIAERPLADQQVDAFAGIVRLLDPEPALAFWRDLEQRIAREDAWEWADGLLLRLETVIGPESRLLPAVTATKALIAARRPGGEEVSAGFWQAALGLALGAVAGGVVGAHAGGAVSELVTRGVLALAARSLSPATETVQTGPISAVAGAVSAALELDDEAWAAVRDTDWFRAALERLRAHGVPAAQAVAALAEARDGTDGLELVQLARQLVAEREADDGPRTTADWTDWSPPDGLAERCLLAALVSTRSKLAADDAVVVAELVESARASKLRDIDAERLCAAHLLRRVHAGSTDIDELLVYEFSERDGYSPARQPACRLHGTQPRLVVVVAVGWALLGQPQRAEDLLRTRLEEAVRSAADADTVADVQLALAWIFRLYRIEPRTWSLGVASPAADREQQATARLLGLPERALLISKGPPQKAAIVPKVPAENVLGASWKRLRTLEIRALDEPDRASEGLRVLAEQARPTAPTLAHMAWTLAVLALARAGLPIAPDVRSQAPRSHVVTNAGDPTRGWKTGWNRRYLTAISLTADPPDPVGQVGDDPSPELAIPPPAAPGSAPPTPSGTISAYSGMRQRSKVRFQATTLLKATMAMVALAYAGLTVWAGVALSGVSWIFPALVGLAVFTALLVGLWSMLARSGNPRRLFGRYYAISIEPGSAEVSTLQLMSGTGPGHLQTRDGPGATIARLLDGGRRPRGGPATLKKPDADHKDARIEPDNWRLPRWPLGIVRIEIDVPASLSAEPWEHWIAGAAGRPEDYYVWVRPSSRWPEWGPPPGAPTYAGPDWLANRDVEVLPPEFGAPGKRSGADVSYLPTTRLIHLIGRPVRTSAGWRLRVDEDHSNDSEDPREAPYTVRREHLLVPLDLARLGAVIVVQGSPSLDAAEAFGVDREGIMAFAADTLEAGAAAVLVVPPLGEMIAGQVVDLTTAWARNEGQAQPVGVLALLADIATLVDQTARKHGIVARPRAQEDVVGFVRFADI
jgi:hypothetical protein